MPSSPLRRSIAGACAGLLALAGLAACGDDDDDGGAGLNTSTTAPEDVSASMPEVLAALPALVEHGRAAASLARTGDYTTAFDEYEELLDVWARIEGTIQDIDPAIHDRIEAAQRMIEVGARGDDADRIQEGSDAQEAAVNDFRSAQAQSGGTTGGPVDSSTSTTTENQGAGDAYATDDAAMAG